MFPAPDKAHGSRSRSPVSARAARQTLRSRPVLLPAGSPPAAVPDARAERPRPPHSPGVDLQLAGGHVAAGELVHAVVPPVVGGEDAKQQRARLREGARMSGRSPPPAPSPLPSQTDASRCRRARCRSLPAPRPARERHTKRLQHLLPVDRLLRLLLDLLLRDPRLHRHLAAAHSRPLRTRRSRESSPGEATAAGAGTRVRAGGGRRRGAGAGAGAGGWPQGDRAGAAAAPPPCPGGSLAGVVSPGIPAACLCYVPSDRR